MIAKSDDSLFMSHENDVGDIVMLVRDFDDKLLMLVTDFWCWWQILNAGSRRLAEKTLVTEKAKPSPSTQNLTNVGEAYSTNITIVYL